MPAQTPLAILLDVDVQLEGIATTTFNNGIVQYDRGSKAFWTWANELSGSESDLDNVTNDLVTKMRNVAKKASTPWKASDTTVSRFRTFKFHNAERLQTYKLAAMKWPTYNLDKGKLEYTATTLDVTKYVTFINQDRKGWFKKDGSLTEDGKAGFKKAAEARRDKMAARLVATYDWATEGIVGEARVTYLSKLLHDLTGIVAAEKAALSEADRKVVSANVGKAIKAAMPKA